MKEILKIKELKKHFGGVKAVDGATFNIKKNSITALIGPNGSGKTTIFNLISGITPADSGSIKFNGNLELIKKSIEHISNLGISRLFQKSRLFGNLTIEENLYLSLNNEDTRFWKNILGYKITSEDKKKVNEMAKTMDITHFMKKDARDLSFGQKRLAEIARAILKPHELLMLDEPVAGVNPKLRRDISKILLKLKKKGETILLIEHDMGFTLNVADYVIVMDEGKVIAQGSPKEIKNNKKVLEAYLGD